MKHATKPNKHVLAAMKFSRIMRRTFEERFWKRVDVKGPNECHEWTGCTTGFGYGVVSRHCKHAQTHRVAWELKNGKIPKGKVVLHKCDNPPCCNVNHLFLGTKKDNMRDMIGKGRQIHPKGSEHQFAKLTESKVKEIRKLWYMGVRTKDIGWIFNVKPCTINHVMSGRSWRHVV